MRQEIITRWQAGLTYSQIATALGVTRNVVAGHVHRWRILNGLAKRPHRVRTRPYKPRQLHASRFYSPMTTTNLRVIRLFERIEAGQRSLVSIADESGVSLKSLSRWRHGTEPRVFLLRCVEEVVYGKDPDGS